MIRVIWAAILVLSTLIFVSCATCPVSAEKNGSSQSNAVRLSDDSAQATQQLKTFLAANGFTVKPETKGSKNNIFIADYKGLPYMFSISTISNSVDLISVFILYTIRDEYLNDRNKVLDLLDYVNNKNANGSLSIVDGPNLFFISNITFVDTINLDEIVYFIEWYNNDIGALIKQLPADLRMMLK